MRERDVRFYHVHRPPDQHPEVSPSWLLARGLDLAAPEEFFPIVEGIPGTHFGTEKPPQVAMVEWFRARGLPAELRWEGAKG